MGAWAHEGQGRRSQAEGTLYLQIFKYTWKEKRIFRIKSEGKTHANKVLQLYKIMHTPTLPGVEQIFGQCRLSS